MRAFLKMQVIFSDPRMIRTLIANIPHSGMYDFENAHVKSIYHCQTLAKKLGFGLPKCSLGARSKADDLANLIWAARLQNFPHCHGELPGRRDWDYKRIGAE